MLDVDGRTALMTRQWADALEHVVVRHPNRSVKLRLHLTDEHTPMLTFRADANPSSDTDEIITPFHIADVKLTYFPGVTLARQWLAAAWGCFLQHEALELVTVDDLKTRVLDPHKHRHWLDHMFHKGFPCELTPETLLIALSTAVPLADAEALVANA